MANETTLEKSEITKPKRSLRFKVGVFLLIVNTPIGYGGSALAAVIGLKTKHPAIGAGAALGIYILSWNMLGLGIWMAGPEGLKLVKDLRKRWFRKKKTQPETFDPSTG
ncbi:MAG TPA: hypothetical protein PLG94_07610 [Smithellaceae bacterium]|jgi:hypothetical protein|nr:hypothetical protein [Smithella sp.]HOG82655.1 hypothetical protein [Smithellaceae bacterium]HOQ43378.1 hypothetical protein [Smithellaceae bacterium]HPL66383.1 hypothetical protein [Smithellaceae bacterium]